MTNAAPVMRMRRILWKALTQPFTNAVGLLKRMWVAPSVRGLGLGRRLLYELEDRGRDHGVRLMRLETKAELGEAVQMYRTSGYCEVVPFNDEPYADHWFEKPLS